MIERSDGDRSTIDITAETDIANKIVVVLDQLRTWVEVKLDSPIKGTSGPESNVFAEYGKMLTVAFGFGKNFINFDTNFGKLAGFIIFFSAVFGVVGGGWLITTSFGIATGWVISNLIDANKNYSNNVKIVLSIAVMVFAVLLFVGLEIVINIALRH